jgi:TPR repeat protein
MACKYLEERGLRCFLSSRDIPKGVEWPSAIAAALKTSKLFLAIFSNNYNLSMQVNKELTIASKRHIPLLTFKTTEDDFEGTKDYFLSEVNFITAYPDAEMALKPLYDDISALLKSVSSVDADAPEEKLSFTYQEDRERIVKDLLSQKPKEPSKRLELANKLAQYKEWQTAFYWYKKASEKDLPDAVFRLAECFLNGLGTKDDCMKAIELYEKAFELGVIPAANRLGHLYYEGCSGMSPDYTKSLEWFERSNSEECPDTYEDLANYYSDGKACAVDESKAFMFRKKYYDYHFYNALENENSESMCILGALCEEGKGVDQNDAYALSWYERAAKNGSSKAKYRLAEMYEKGSGVVEDTERAFKYMEEASVFYDKAMVKLGDYYRSGTGTPENPSKAFQCYLLASAASSAEAWNRVGMCYEKGIGTKKNPAKSEEFYRRAANQGLLDAKSALGNLLFSLGRVSEGVDVLEEAAREDDYNALIALGIIYSRSADDEKYVKAVSCVKRASEVKADNGDALFRLGLLYRWPKSSIHDPEKSFEYFNASAKLGHYGAMRFLAYCYVAGEGTDQDDFMAFSWASKAVEGGDTISLNSLGEYYRYGIGTKKNPEKAIECYKKYTEGGRGIMGAVNIGEMYFYGEGVPVDYDEATKWLQMACDGSFAQPYVLIGRMYEMGVYGEKNISQAISWYKKGVQIGSPFAEYYLGCCYANDEILPDPVKAVEYYSKASEAGLMEAKLELAKCYRQGVGIEQDKKRAFYLYHEIASRWLEMRQAIGSYVNLAVTSGGTVNNDRQSELKKPLYSEAMYSLGRCYIDGSGTDIMISEGVKWITIASKLGNEDAAKYNLSESFQKDSIIRNDGNNIQ